MFFCYLCGVLGILYAMTFILILDCREVEAALLVAAVCAAIWAAHFGKRKHPVLAKVLCIVVVGAVLYDIRAVKGQLEMLIHIAGGKVAVPQQIDLTETLVLLGMLCAVMLFWLAFIVKKAWIVYFFTIPIVFLGPLLGQILDIKELCLFAFFHMGTSVMGSMHGNGRQPGRKSGGNIQAAGKYTALLAVFFLAALLLSHTVTEKQMDRLMTASAKVEGYVRQATSGWLDPSKDSGTISRSNSYPSGQKQLEIISSSKPEENLYLKSFTGHMYMDGSWSVAGEELFSDEAAQSDGKSPDKAGSSYENRRFYLVQSEKGEPEQNLTVRYINGNKSEVYAPYVSQIKETLKDGYTVQMYEWRDLEEVLLGPETEAVWQYLQSEEQYRQYAAQMYLQVPDDSFSRLKALCDEHPMTEEGKITEFILGTLHTMASYTLMPGVVPYGQDPIEYFLFESGRGYCQQFASAAVLMYRLYDIPARYVTGYLANASAFVQQEDGTCRAVLDDGRAHAWAEIYLPEQGWIPVETTPPGSVTTPEAAPPQESEDEPEPQPETPEVTEEAKMPDKAAEGPPESAKRNEILLPVLGVLAKAAAVFAAAVVLRKYVIIRRRRRRRRYRMYRADRLFARTVEVLHFGGIMKEYGGMEERFCVSLSELIPEISQSEAEAAVRMVCREIFGPERISRKDTNAVLAVYEKVCRHVYRNLKGPKKWYFQYGKVYW